MIVLAVAAALRFGHLDADSLWLDEGSTVYLSQLPWRDVLGLNGPYDPHPPAYYALVKVVRVFFVDELAGRLLSALTGTLTVGAVYLLGRSLMGGGVGLAASAVLATSPIHIWYSQEARQYVPCVLAVALSYLAIVEFQRRPQMRWAAGYAVSTAAAVHLDFSAAFALAPQLFVVALIVRRRGSAALPLLGSGIAAIVLVLPLMSWLGYASSALGSSQQYAVSPQKLASAALGIAGVAGNAAFSGTVGVGFYWGSEPAAWDHGWFVAAALALGVVVALCAGTVQLWRTSRVAVAVVVALLSTILIAAAVSMVRTAFIDRAVLAAVVGWALVVGSAVVFSAQHRRDAWMTAALRNAAVAAVGVLTFAVGFSLVAALAGGVKQDWRALAADVAASRGNDRNALLVTYPTLTRTLIEVYEPEAAVDAIVVDDGPKLPSAWSRRLGDASAVWLSYIVYPGIEEIQNELTTRGFEIQQARYYPDKLVIEYWIQVETSKGHPAGGDAGASIL